MGLNVLQTTSIQGTYGWVFGNEDGSGTSGALTIGPDSGSGGTSVSLTLGSSGDPVQRSPRLELIRADSTGSINARGSALFRVA
jgi:hypothetical protein